MNRALFLVLITVLVVPPGRGEPPMVCTADGCHALESDYTIPLQHVDGLLRSLHSFDPALASAVEVQLESHPGAAGEILDRLCLIGVSINAESRVKVDSGAARPVLVSDRWNTFLIRIQNLAGVTAPLSIRSDQEASPQHSSTRDRWLQIRLRDDAHLPRVLHGAPVEYRIVRLKTGETGKRAAVLAMDVGQGTGDIGFRGDVLLTFDCLAQGTASHESAPTKP